MANSRKDSRGYVLRTGESERKDGRYSYSYTDLERNRRTVYAKTLVELRKIERKIIRDKEDGLDPQLADRMTLNQLYDKYIEQKYDRMPIEEMDKIVSFIANLDFKHARPLMEIIEDQNKQSILWEPVD